MDKQNKIFTFESVGWTDPSSTSASKAVDWFKNREFEQNVYPDNLINETKPPTIVFVPDKYLMQKMIEVVMQSRDRHECLYKFHDI